ncbi:MAG: hypothetical protein ACOYXB_17425 [Bacteroidota bacterium]
MRRLFSFYLLLFVTAPLTLFSQSPDLKETFLEAESYFLFEEYSEALPLYLRIHREDPENDDINYKIGVCYLNDPFEKDKSIRYLADASENINPKYRENNFKERAAPPEVVFYLGKAYLVNDRIEDAIREFNRFLSIVDEKIYDTDLVREQIDACNAAIELKKKPVDTDFLNLGDKINTRFSDINPVVSGDEQSIVYVSKLQFYDAAFYSTKVNGEWTPPRNIVPELGVDGDVYPTALSYDGKELFIYRNDDFIGNLYHSTLVNGVWTPLEKLGEPISTKYWESHASVSRDGKTLYFTSNRKDGYGGLDIYTSERQPNGSWGQPVNLGPKVNSRLNEETPFISDNGQILYFSSYGHYNMGGYDIFFSRKNNQGEWSEPINLGYPVNSTGDDFFFQPVRNGNAAYLSCYRPDGFGRFDIYRLEIYSVDNPRMYLVSGSLQSKTGLEDDDHLLIYLIDTKTGDTLTLTQPDLSSGSFNFSVPEGLYNMVIRSEKYEDLIRPLRITSATSRDGLTLPDDLVLVEKPEPAKILTGPESRIVPDDTLYVVTSGKPLDIKMKVEKDSKLTAEWYSDSTLVRTNQYDLNSRKFTYTMRPKPGTNRLELKMTESNGDVSLRTVIVERKEAVVSDAGQGTKTSEPALTVSEEPDYSDVNRALELLLEASKGELKKYLEEFDPEDAGTTTTPDLLTYLRKHAEMENFTPGDVDQAAARVIAGDDPEELLSALKAGSSENLKAALGLADSTLAVPELITAIRNSLPEQSVSDTELDKALGEAINNSESTAEKLRQRLIGFASGDLKTMLEKTDTEAEGLVTENDLLDYLKENISRNGISLEELDNLLARMIADGDLNRLKQFMSENSREGLRDAVGLTIPGKDDVVSVESFMDHVRTYSSSNKFDEEDIFATLRKAVKAVPQTRLMLEELLKGTDGELLSFLKGIDPQSDSLYSVHDLTALLLKNAGDKYSMEELITALTSLIHAAGPADLLARLREIAPDKFRLLLEAAAKNIGDMDSISDLIRFLLEHAAEYNLSANDIWDLLLSTRYDLAFNGEEEKAGGLGDLGRIIVFGGFAAAAGALLIIIIFWYRRRKKDEEKAA